MATVAKIQAELDLDTGRFHGAVTSAIGGVKKFDSAVGGADKSLRNIERRVTGFGASLRDTAVVLGQFRAAMHTVWAFTGQWVGAIIQANAKLERLQVLMKGMSKGANEAERMAAAMKDMNYVLGKAKNAPFAMDEIANAFVKLKSAGIDPAKGSLDALIDSVAAFGGDDQTFHRATIAIQQMAGKGVISMEELRQQLGEAVPNAMTLMARGMNMSMAELVKAISTGRVEANDALGRLFREMKMEFGGAGKELMSTWTGMVSKLKTEWLLFAAEIGKQGMFAGAKRGLNDLITFMSSTAGKNFASDIGRGIAMATNMLVAMLKWLVANRNELMTVAKWVVTAFATAKIASFTTAIIGSLAALAKMAAGIRLVSAASMAARVAQVGWTGAIAAAAGPIGIAIGLIGGLIMVLNHQRTAAMNASAAMTQYYRATAAGQLVSPEQHQQNQEHLSYLKKVPELLKKANSAPAVGRGQQVNSIMDDLRKRGLTTRELEEAFTGASSVGERMAIVNKAVTTHMNALTVSVVRQGQMQTAEQIRQGTETYVGVIEEGTAKVGKAASVDQAELFQRFNSGKMSLPKYQEERAKNAKRVFDAQTAYLNSQNANLKKQYDQAAGNETAQAQIADIIKANTAKLAAVHEERAAMMESIVTPGTLLPKMGADKDGAGAAKKNPLAEYMETIIGKHAQLKAQLDDGNPTLEKFNAQLAAGAYGKNPDGNMVAGIRKLLEANQALAEELKVNNATDQLKESLEELEASSAADVVSAQVEATGDMYSQVSAGMVGFNRQVAVLGMNLDKTKMSRQEFDEWVTKIRKNIAAVDMIGLEKFVANAEWEAYLDSLPKRSRDLAEYTRKLEENRLMISQMKLANPENAQKLDQLGARNAAAITQEYANATRPAWAQLLDEWSDTTTAMDKMWANSMQSFTDTLVEAVTTGKASFKDLATGILKEITRILISKAVAQLAKLVIGMFGGAASGGGGGTSMVSGAFGGAEYANGGIHTPQGTMPLHKYATGGIANSPQMAIFGEGRSPEAYVPLPDGRSIPVTMDGGGSGVANAVTVSVQVNNDGSATSDTQAQNEQAKQLGQAIDVRVREVFTKEMRPNGILWKMKNGG